MKTTTNVKPFSAPLMHAFRSAFEAGDSQKSVEIRNAGERVLSGRRSAHRRGADESALRRDLVIDLLSLLNTVDLGSTVELNELDYVQKSIINFGLYDISHLTSEEGGVDLISQDLMAALAHYEPRLIEDTLAVEREEINDDVEQKVRFLISAEMHCAPLDVPVEFVADVDTSTGKVKLSKLAMLK